MRPLRSLPASRLASPWVAQTAADVAAGFNPRTVAAAADVGRIPRGHGAQAEILGRRQGGGTATGIDHFSCVEGQIAPGNGGEAAICAADIQAGHAVDLGAAETAIRRLPMAGARWCFPE